MNKDKKVSIPLEELVGYYRVVKEFQEFYLPLYKQVEKEFPQNPVNATRVNHNFMCLLKKHTKEYEN